MPTGSRSSAERARPGALLDHYDRAYFDRWYRNPRHRVFTAEDRSRRAAVAVAASELMLGRRIRSVLDVGCGEGHWRAPLRRLRPRVRYVGVDPSPYAVKRFGRSRGIRLGSVESIDALNLSGPFDLVLAVGFLNVLSARRIDRALGQLRPLIGGVALLELFTVGDHLTGDIGHYTLQSKRQYHSVLKRHGLVPIGLHLYTTTDAADNLAELERG